MECASCAAMLEIDLEDADIKGKCSFATSELRVESDHKDIDNKVRQIVEKAGYQLKGS